MVERFLCNKETDVCERQTTKYRVKPQFQTVFVYANISGFLRHISVASPAERRDSPQNPSVIERESKKRTQTAVGTYRWGITMKRDNSNGIILRIVIPLSIGSTIAIETESQVCVFSLSLSLF